MVEHSENSHMNNSSKGFLEGPLARRIVGTGRRRTVTLAVATATAGVLLFIAQWHDSAARNMPSTPPLSPSSGQTR